MKDEEKHRVLRKSVQPAFSPSNVVRYEHCLTEPLRELLDVLEERKIFDIPRWMNYYAMDSASIVAFGRSPGCLRSAGDADGSLALTQQRLNHWGRWAATPSLEALFHRNFLALKMASKVPSVSKKAAEMLRVRLSDGSKTSDDLMQSFIEARNVTPRIDNMQIVSLVISTITGASDTTATTVSAAFYYVHQDPKNATAMVEELQQANLSGVPSYEQVARLPFLNAVIKETMRMCPILSRPMERIVPAGGITICGSYVPAGTTVGCAPLVMHRNTAVYGSDAGVFRPRRWLDADSEKLKTMDAAHLGFSRGRRVCLGQYIAVMQMKKVLSAVMLRFKVCQLMDVLCKNINGCSSSAWSPRIGRSKAILRLPLEN